MNQAQQKALKRIKEAERELKESEHDLKEAERDLKESEHELREAERNLKKAYALLAQVAQTNMETKEPFKQMTVGKLIALLKEFPANEPICMTSRLEQSTKFTAINYVGREDHGNIVISLKDSLL